MIEKHYDLRIVGYAPEAESGTAVINEYNSRERLARAVRIAGITWAISLAGILIPVAHFLIVPGGTILGFYLFFSRLKHDVVPADLRGTCPDCGTGQKFELAGATWQPPEGVTCCNCLRNLKLVVKDSD